jgi:hypothetical protein
MYVFKEFAEFDLEVLKSHQMFLSFKNINYCCLNNLMLTLGV